MLRNLQDIEAEFGAQVSVVVGFVGNPVAKAGAQPGILHGHRKINGRMTEAISGIVTQGSESESVLVDVAGVAQHPGYKIAAAGIVKDVGELFIAKRVVAYVLDDRTTVSEAVRPLQFFRGAVGKALEQRGNNVGIPSQIDNFLMGKDGIAHERAAAEEQQRNQRQGAGVPHAVTEMQIQGCWFWCPRQLFTCGWLQKTNDHFKNKYNPVRLRIRSAASNMPRRDFSQGHSSNNANPRNAGKIANT